MYLMGANLGTVIGTSSTANAKEEQPRLAGLMSGSGNIFQTIY